MTWLTPTLAATAAAIAIPALVILYFLKLRRRDVEVSTTLLWKKSIQDMQANAPFQRLRRNILLLLQLIALAALLVALAQPQLPSDMGVGTRHIILIDRSASMNATDSDGPTRLDDAKRDALDIVESLRAPGLLERGEGDQAMVIAFDIAADVRAQFTSDAAALRAAIESIEPTDAPSRLEEAFRLAKAHAPTRRYVDDRTGNILDLGITAGPPATVHLFSDGRLPDAENALPGPDDRIIYHPQGNIPAGDASPSASNLAITSIRAQRNYENPDQLSVFIGVLSTALVPIQADIELAIDGIVERILPATIPAAARVPGAPDTAPPEPGTTGVVFRLTRSQAATIAARVSSSGAGTAEFADALPSDDAGWVVVPPARRTAVAVVTRGDLYLSAALAGLPLAQLTFFTPEEYAAARTTGAIDTFDVTIFDRVLPTLPEGQSLPPGRHLVLGALPPPPLGFIDGGIGEPSTIIDTRRDHPVMAPLVLDALVLAETRIATPAPDASITILASTDKGPAIAELTGPDTRAIVVTFDPAESTWPFDVSFVVFLAASIDHLAADLTLDRASQLRPGGILATRLPSGASNVQLQTPTGRSASLEPAADGRVVFGPIDRAGLYTLTWSGDPGPTDAVIETRPTRTIAANLADPRESDIAPQKSLALASQTVQAQTEGTRTAARDLWPWILLAGIGLLTLEWYVYNRKVYL